MMIHVMPYTTTNVTTAIFHFFGGEAVNEPEHVPVAGLRGEYDGAEVVGEPRGGCDHPDEPALVVVPVFRTDHAGDHYRGGPTDFGLARALGQLLGHGRRLGRQLEVSHGLRFRRCR